MTAAFDGLERLMRERRSERQFLPDPVPSELLNRLLDVATSAPSASNRQAYRFMAVTRRTTIERMVAAVFHVLEQNGPIERARLGRELADYTKNFLAFAQAPVVVVVFFRAQDQLAQMLGRAESGDGVVEVRESLSSAAAFVMQFLLAVQAMGLGACWMTGPCVAEGELLELLDVPKGLRLAAIIPVGRVSERSRAPRKRRLEQLRLSEPCAVEELAEHDPPGDKQGSL